MSFDVINPDHLGPPRGYNHGMLAAAGGRVLFVAGQNACEPDGRVPAVSFEEQFERALVKVLSVVAEAGGTPEDLGRMTVYVTSLAAYEKSRPALSQVWKKHMGRHYPAVALVEVTGLVDAGAEVELEATAVIR